MGKNTKYVVFKQTLQSDKGMDGQKRKGMAFIPERNRRAEAKISI